MNTWSKVEPGMTVMHQGEEHTVSAVKRGGAKLRVVLAPVTDGLAAKVALRVAPSDAVEFPEGAESQAEDAIEASVVNDLGGELLGVVDSKQRLLCPPVDTTTVAAHLKLVHGVELGGLPIADEDAMLKVHEELHEAPFHQPAHPHEHGEVA